MKIVYVCSPLKGDIEQNRANAEEYCATVIGEQCVPIAPHVFYTRILDDEVTEERDMGLKIGMELLKVCDELWVFGTTISEGMAREIKWWTENKEKPIVLIGQDGCLV